MLWNYRQTTKKRKGCTKQQPQDNSPEDAANWTFQGQPKKEAEQKQGKSQTKEVGIIRNITNDAVALSVAKTLSTDDVLSQLIDSSWLQKERVFLSKKELSEQIGICEMTLIRWEKSIIKSNLSFCVHYWNMKGDIKKLKRFNEGKSMGYRLDYFQRFVISTIAVIKAGGFTQGLPIKHDHEVITWLKETESGQKVKRLFDRDLFKQSTNNQKQRKAS